MLALVSCRFGFTVELELDAFSKFSSSTKANKPVGGLFFSIFSLSVPILIFVLQLTSFLSTSS